MYRIILHASAFENHHVAVWDEGDTPAARSVLCFKDDADIFALLLDE